MAAVSRGDQLSLRRAAGQIELHGMPDGFNRNCMLKNNQRLRKAPLESRIGGQKAFGSHRFDVFPVGIFGKSPDLLLVRRIDEHHPRHERIVFLIELARLEPSDRMAHQHVRRAHVRGLQQNRQTVDDLAHRLFLLDLAASAKARAVITADWSECGNLLLDLVPGACGAAAPGQKDHGGSRGASLTVKKELMTVDRDQRLRTEAGMSREGECKDNWNPAEKLHVPVIPVVQPPLA